MNEPRSSHEQVMNKFRLLSREQAMSKLRKSHEQVLEKLLTASNEQAMKMS